MPHGKSLSFIAKIKNKLNWSLSLVFKNFSCWFKYQLTKARANNSAGSAIAVL